MPSSRNPGGAVSNSPAGNDAPLNNAPIPGITEPTGTHRGEPFVAGRRLLLDSATHRVTTLCQIRVRCRAARTDTSRPLRIRGRTQLILPKQTHSCGARATAPSHVGQRLAGFPAVADRPPCNGLTQSGRSASTGVAAGEVALDEARAGSRHVAGVGVILVRRDAETSDIAALEFALGLLTQRGARTSHAAVVARQPGQACVVGSADLSIDEASSTVKVGGTTLVEGDVVTLDGNEGTFNAGAVRVEIACPEELLARLETLRQRSRVV